MDAQTEKMPWDIQNEELEKRANEIYLQLDGCSFNDANTVWNKVVAMLNNTRLTTLPQAPTPTNLNSI